MLKNKKFILFVIMTAVLLIFFNCPLSNSDDDNKTAKEIKSDSVITAGGADSSGSVVSNSGASASSSAESSNISSESSSSACSSNCSSNGHCSSRSSCSHSHHSHDRDRHHPHNIFCGKDKHDNNHNCGK